MDIDKMHPLTSYYLKKEANVGPIQAALMLARGAKLPLPKKIRKASLADVPKAVGKVVPKKVKKMSLADLPGVRNVLFPPGKGF